MERELEAVPNVLSPMVGFVEIDELEQCCCQFVSLLKLAFLEKARGNVLELHAHQEQEFPQDAI